MGLEGSYPIPFRPGTRISHTLEIAFHVKRNSLYDFFFCRSHGPYLIIETLDQHFAVSILHGLEQMDHTPCRIGDKRTVVA